MSGGAWLVDEQTGQLTLEAVFGSQDRTTVHLLHVFGVHERVHCVVVGQAARPMGARNPRDRIRTGMPAFALVASSPAVASYELV